MRHRLVSFGPLLLVSVACGRSNPSPSAAAADSIRVLDAALSRAVSERNLEGIMSFYADDAVLLPAAEPMITGKAAIQEEWEHILAIPDFLNESSLRTVEVSAQGDLAYTIGSYLATVLGEDGTLVREPGKFLTVWKRQANGTWLIAVDMYNTDIPPPDHK